MTIHLYQNDLPDGLSFGTSVAIDTETMGLNPARDRLCLVQLSSGDGNAHLVQFTDKNYAAPNLRKLLEDQNVLKIFHFGRFDIAIMQAYLGVVATPVYCTKIASRLCRTFTDRHGLKDLCRDLIQTEVNKGQQTSDWGAPVLTEDQKNYAAGDVLYLHQLKEKLDVMLKREGRTGIAQACFDFLPARSHLDLVGWDEFDIFAHLIMMANTIPLDTTRNDLDHARRVLDLESQALNALSKSLDGNFVQAIETIQAMKDKATGRLIVAGIGKSGHVARKIAATLASTGTPSYYIHPGEASHGDLGMITDADVVILLSNSGENNELIDLISYCKRFHIPLIGMTSNPESTLAKHSTIPLVMPKMPEASLEVLAPTTSTTMMMALGDAIAIALLERMGLTPDQFRVFHPGGKLGAKLKKVSEFMISGKDLPLVTPDTLFSEALLISSEKNLGSMIIVDENQNLLGIVTDGDLKRHMGPELLTHPVKEIMSTNPKTIPSDLLAAEALDMMLNGFGSPITSLIIADQGKIQGLIRIQELLRAGIA